jgi:hypothetical protein
LVIIDPSSAVIWYKNSPAEITTGWVALSGAGLISLILSQIGMFAVHSIDDLMAIASAATNKFATYDGWVTGGDAGGSAFYHWDSLSVETHNGFSVVQPLDQGVDPTVPGRWVQKPA